MKALGYIILITLCFTSCRSSKTTATTNTTTVDTTTTKVRHVITYDTITIPKDSIVFKFPIAEIKQTPITKTSSSGRVKATVKKVDNDLQVECHVEELIKIIENQNTIIETLTKRLKTQTTTITKIEYRTKWYLKGLAALGVLVLALYAVKILKPF